MTINHAIYKIMWENMLETQATDDNKSAIYKIMWENMLETQATDDNKSCHL